MHVEDAQRDVRTVFIGGFAGQLVSGMVWALSAALGTWRSPRLAVLVLVVGGMFIFPLTQILLRVMGRRASLSKGHPMNGLAMQTAFIVPFSLPLVAAATMHHMNWFYPAFMIVVGVHYMPFIFLYGMRMFGVLAGILIGAGVLIALYANTSFSLGGWFTAVVLFAFAFIGRGLAIENRTVAASA